MRTLREILQRQDPARAEMRALNDAAGPDGALGEEQQARWSALEAEIAALRSAEQRQATLDDLDRGAAGRPLGGGGAPGRPEVRVFSGAPTSAPEAFDGAVLRAQTGERVPVLEARHRLADFVPQTESRAQELGFGGFLRALHNGPQTELERRVLDEAAVGTGGALVPTPVAADGQRHAEVRAHHQRPGRRLARGERADRGGRAGLRGDNPDRKELGSDHPRLAGASGGRAEPRRGVALGLRQLRRARAGLGTVSMGTNGGPLSATPTWGAFLDAIALLEAANAGDNLAAIMAPRTARTTYAFTDSTGEPLTLPPRLSGIPQFVSGGVPINQTQGTAVNATSVLLGDFREVFVGLRTGLTVFVLPERYADNGQVGFLAWLRADVAVARPAAMARIIGITP